MKKRSKFFPDHFSKTSVVGFSIAILLALGSLYFLIFMKPKFNSSELKVTGKVLDKSNVVTRQVAGSLAFFELKKGDSIFEGDEIYTDENSSATIAMTNSKTKVFLLSKSLIRIQETDNTDSLEIKDGNAQFTIAPNQKLNLYRNNARLKLINNTNKESVASANINEGKLSLTSNEGKLNVSNDKQSALLSANETLNVDKRELKKNQSLIVFTPKPFEQLSTEMPLTIEWDSREKVILTIAKKNDLANPIIQIESDKKTYTHPTLLAAGVYNIQLYAKTLDEKSALDVVLVPKYSIGFVNPKDKDKIKQGRSSVKMKLSWEKIDAKGYKVTYWDGDKAEKEITTQTNDLFLSNLKGPTVRWQVSAQMKNGRYATPTAISTFTLEKIKTNQLTSPSNQNTFYINDGAIPFTWESSEGEEFNLQISESDSQLNVVNKELAQNSFNFDPPYPGPYELVLHSKDVADLEDLVFKFKVLKKYAIWKTRIPSYLENSQIGKDLLLEFNISENESPNAFLEISDTMDFKNIVDQVEASSGSIKYKIGSMDQYCFRIRSEEPSEYLTTSDVQCTFTNKINFPRLQSPKEITLGRNILLELDNCILEASPITNASVYEFQIFRDPGMKDEIFKEESKTNKLIWFNGDVGILNYRRANVASGSFYYRYRVMDKYGRASNYSNVAKINLPGSIFKYPVYIIAGLLILFILYYFGKKWSAKV